MTGLLFATLTFIASPQASAWTPYGYGPYGPGTGPQGERPQPGGQPPAAGAETGEPPSPAEAYPTPGFDRGAGFPYGPAAPGSFYGEGPWGPPPSPPAVGFPPEPPGGFPGAGGRPGFGPQTGFRVSRDASEDAYVLNIELNGMSPDEIQVRTQGQWIILSRDSSRRKVQEDSFEDGRGYMRSYSFSSGTASRRFTVPRDGNLEAMTREEDESGIRIRIPRGGYAEPRP
jgi:hypothetical protein